MVEVSLSTLSLPTPGIHVHLTAAERRLLVDNSDQPASKPDMGQVPRSALLDKLQGFLPSMQRANAELESQMQACARTCAS
jgi:hypothetical protein